MNIALITPFFPRADRTKDRFFPEFLPVLLRRYRSDGHRVTVFALEENTDPAAAAAVAVSELTAKSSGEKLSDVVLRTMSSFREIIHSVRRGNFEAVHNNCLSFLTLAQIHQLPVPVVTTLRVPPRKQLGVGVALAALAENHEFVAVNHDLARRWRAVVGRDCPVIPDGVDLEEQNRIYAPYLKTAIWMGRIRPGKGLEEAISAVEEEDFRLAITGPVSDVSYFTREIEPRLNERVRYLGYLPRRKLLEVAGKAQCGIYTATDQKARYSPLDMLASGTPVVAYDNPATREIIRPRYGCLVPTGDVKALSRSLPVTANLNRLSCRAYVRDRYSDRVMGQRYTEAFSNLGMR